MGISYTTVWHSYPTAAYTH